MTDDINLISTSDFIKSGYHIKKALIRIYFANLIYYSLDIYKSVTDSTSLSVVHRFIAAMEEKDSIHPDVNPNGWQMRKMITHSDVAARTHFIKLDNDDVKQYILAHWNDNKIKRATIDDIKMMVEDLDTKTEHEVNFRYYKPHDSYYLEGLWRKNFIDRRFLLAGDEIGLNYDPVSAKLLFRVLNRAKSSNSRAIWYSSFSYYLSIYCDKQFVSTNLMHQSTTLVF